MEGIIKNRKILTKDNKMIPIYTVYVPKLDQVTFLSIMQDVLALLKLCGWMFFNKWKIPKKFIQYIQGYLK